MAVTTPGCVWRRHKSRRETASSPEVHFLVPASSLLAMSSQRGFPEGEVGLSSSSTVSDGVFYVGDCAYVQVDRCSQLVVRWWVVPACQPLNDDGLGPRTRKVPLALITPRF
jgi:hypothetical protein